MRHCLNMTPELILNIGANAASEAILGRLAEVANH
jgi:hypothetical protein